MELKDFITATLVEINEGVQNAINELRDKKIQGAINPVFSSDGKINAAHANKQGQTVEFDIAVTSENQSSSAEKGNMKGGIKVVSGSIDKTLSDSETDSRTSRIKFSVPFVPPITPVNSANIKAPGIR